MTELELGQATLVYEDPEEGRTERTVDNEELLYARDHWLVTVGTDDDGNDLMRHVPRDRVHYVERNVEKFEDQAQSVRHRVESIASDLRQKLPMDIGDGGRGHREDAPSESTTVQIETSKEGVEDDEEEAPSESGS
jgi:hypothetical protein